MASPAPVTPAQKLAALIGALAVLFGALGFIGGSDFGAGSELDTSGRFIGFAVNGWTNLAHLALGVVLLACSGRRVPTRVAWRLAALVYLVAVLYGFVDGRDVFELLPLNTGMHILDCAMLVISLAGAHAAKERRGIVELDRVAVPPATGVAVVGPGSGHVGGPRRFAARIDSRL
ncbi:MAG TPA: DUF4383 domain-containing protein [Solirubrobacteraceae bacterium]|jgi:hypothetical protein|nr:DUF4383 domain-containing protein [Solirubrobacteraceae bacterium]